MKQMNAPFWGADPEELWREYRRHLMLTGMPKQLREALDRKKLKGQQGGGVQEAYSLWWLFARSGFAGRMGERPGDQLAQAFLGDVACWERIRSACEKEKVSLGPKQRADYIGQAPNAQQWRAIETAINAPISFIQGPPGTGKTATILNLVYQIAKLKEKKTVAIVSCNGAALENIHDKLRELGEKDKGAAPKLRVARLGNQDNRKSFYRSEDNRALAPHHQTQAFYYIQEGSEGPAQAFSGGVDMSTDWLRKQRGELYRAIRARLDADPNDLWARNWLSKLEELGAARSNAKASRLRTLLKEGWAATHPEGTIQSIVRETGVTVDELFEAGFAAFTSTVHSLPNCFKDGLFYQYDYVIVDETSQMGLIVGLIAMCHAKHLVLVGDEQQLAPVVDEQLLSLLDEDGDPSPREDLDGNPSEGEADEYDPDEYYFDPVEIARAQGYDVDEMDYDSIMELILEPEPDPQETDGGGWANYLPQPEVSFLDLCQSVFLGVEKEGKRRGGLYPDPDPDEGTDTRPKVFLDQHYRCHPGIIGFCNEAVYEPAKTPLEICTKDYDRTVEVPIRVLQFQGDYCQRCYRFAAEKPAKRGRAGREPEQEDLLTALEQVVAREGEPLPAAKLPGRPSKRNLRQVEIFLEEEWPRLLEQLEEKQRKNERFSACILTPFRGQKRALETAILGLGKKVVKAKRDPEKADPTLFYLSIDNMAGPEESGKVGSFTVHESQGQEFDVVYLLPVEDGLWEWPFSQGKRMVNVAVSRAKKELRIIASDKFMRETEGDPAGDEKDKERREKLLMRDLVRYVEEKATADDTARGFGIQRSAMTSIFDGKEPRKTKKGEPSSGQRIVEALLAELAPALGLTWKQRDSRDREVPVSSALLEAGATDVDILKALLGENFQAHPAYHQVFRFLHAASFDCVLRDSSGRPFLAIEVDGAYHRYPYYKEEEGKASDPDKPYQKWRKDWLHDRLKDRIVEAAGGVVYYGNRKNIVKGGEKKVLRQWDRPQPGSFALLRLSDDGSTFLETDALREAAPEDMAGKVFTVQDLIKKYLPSLSAVLRTWSDEERSWLDAHLPEGGSRTSRAQLRLQELGLLQKTDEGWLPTDAGEELGVGRLKGKDNRRKDKEGKFYPVYPAEAQAEIKKLLLEGMEQEEENTEAPVADT